ncbi:MAG: aminopeptidase [Magnetococcales bacterium]|nr:aminopeptidase [Magnetococcales bacterium]
MVNRVYMFLLPILSGCLGPSYYYQTINGHLDLLNRRVSIQQLIKDEKTPIKLKKQLEKTAQYREFAAKTLHLPTKGSYTTYADLKRHKATWVVFAAQPFALTPKKWCFPVTGCLEYLGYFSKADAHKYGEKLEIQGFDVFVDGSPAYSTLGWFDDPLLNTFIHFADEKLIALIFHELAHQKLYVADDPTFNESYAVAVSQIGLLLWYKKHGNSQDLQKIKRQLDEKQEFIKNVQTMTKQMETLYGSSLNQSQKQKQKDQIIADGIQKYGNMWPKGWFSRDLNNAKLNSANTYGRLVGQFMDIFIKVGRDMAKFHKTVDKIAKAEPAKREKMINTLASISDEQLY